jgi:putative DNA-invertase from lambdoid prophage Rac
MKSAIGYLRVSTDKQDMENQRAAINEAAAREGFKVRYIEDQISSRKADRKIYDIVKNLKPGETIIVYELSRLARSIGEVFEITEGIKKRKGALWSLKPEVKTGGKDSLQADMLLFALSTAAQIERDLISERTKNALRARKAAGVKLGRPEGKGRKLEEAAAAKEINLELLRAHYDLKAVSAAGISRLLKVDQRTVRAWLKEHPLQGGGK